MRVERTRAQIRIRAEYPAGLTAAFETHSSVRGGATSDASQPRAPCDCLLCKSCHPRPIKQIIPLQPHSIPWPSSSRRSGAQFYIDRRAPLARVDRELYDDQLVARVRRCFAAPVVEVIQKVHQALPVSSCFPFPPVMLYSTSHRSLLHVPHSLAMTFIRLITSAALAYFYT